MTNTVGRVDFTARIDGRRTPKDAEDVGRKMGASASEGFDETWSKGYRESLDKNARAAFDRWQKSGKQSGGVYGKAFTDNYLPYLKNAEKAFQGLRLDTDFLDDLNKKFDDAGVTAGHMQQRLIDLNREGVISAQVFDGARKQVDEWALAQKAAAAATNDQRDAIARLKIDLLDEKRAREDAAAAIDKINDRNAALSRTLQDNVNSLRLSANESDRLSASFDRLADSQRRSSAATEDHSLHWKELSHNLRQAILITGAVVAAGSDIAALGSVAGAGIVALGGAAQSAAIGIGGLIPVFITLSKELDELPPDLRDVASEFKGLGQTFSDVGEAISRSAFSQMDGAFDSLSDTVRGLTPQFQTLGTTIGGLFDDLADTVRPGTDAFFELQEAVAKASVPFGSLSRDAGTLGLSLVRGFNQATPLVQDFTQWVDRLTDQFDAFTRSTSFDDWIARSRVSWTQFGDLLDATGRMLNDLVTPAAQNRLNDFMGDLEEFMPHLGQLIDIAGRLDVFGLAAQALADLGDALEPLAEPVGDLAEALGDTLSIAIETLAGGIEGIATIVAPAAQALGDFVDALPPEWIAQATTGVLALAGAFKGLQIVASTSAMLGFAGAASAATDASTRLSGAIKGIAGRAGALGLVAGAATLAAGGIQAVIEELGGFDDRATEAIGSSKGLAESAGLIAGSFTYMGKAIEGTTLTTDNLGAALDQLGRQGGGMWNQLTAGFRGVGAETDALATATADLQSALGRLDEPLATLAENNLPAAQAQFRSFALEAGASKTEVLAMLDSMPKLKEAFEQQIESTGGVATAQSLYTLAMQGANAEARNTEGILAQIEGRSTTTGEAIDGLADKIRNFGDATLSTRDASRNFQESIDAATESLAINGANLDTNTAQGRANEAAIDEIAKSALEFAAATYEETSSIEGATAAVQQGRDALIQQMKQFGYTQEEAEAYADELGLIPENIDTIVDLDDSAARSKINGFLNEFSKRVITVRVNGTFQGQNSDVVGFASGGTLTGPSYILAGEAGPEAIVPLDRPLNQVDPSVRYLSAIAQGLRPTPAMASGGTVGSQLSVAEGAIVINDSGDPYRTANEVVRRLAEDVMG